MAAATRVPISEQLKQVPLSVRPALSAARRVVKGIAPKADEIGYPGVPPRSNRSMWKIARYAVDGANVVGIGLYPTYATLFFYRGRELDDQSGLLLGGGKDMRFIRLLSVADAERPVVKRLVRTAFRLGGAG
jgi:hypothetical protein